MHNAGTMPHLIQAGMGVHVSSARLANTTSRLGALGVVSGVGLRHIVVEEIRSGDATAARIARTFPFPRYVEELLSYAPGGSRHRQPAPMDTLVPRRAGLPKRLSAIAAYVEVMRARQGHRGMIGINVMWKCALTVLPTLYGALLADVDVLLCGAGVPMELPDIVRSIRAGADMEYMPLTGTSTHVSFAIADDRPAGLFEGKDPPRMVPILSNYAFPKRIVDVWSRQYDGARPTALVLENHAAGGHNAPPRDRERFGESDDIDRYFDKVLALGVPVYVAGAFANGGSRQDLLDWQQRGAYGIQVGSRFALCDESGLRRDLKDAVIARNQSADSQVVTDNLLSPTGYPFKVVPLDGTISDRALYRQRRRICNRGYLVQSHFEEQPDGTTKETYICPAMPAGQYVRLGGSEADLDDRVCLCNALLATAGILTEGELPVVTLGESGRQVRARATAREIVEDILTSEHVAAMEAALAADAPYHSTARPAHRTVADRTVGGYT